LIVGINIIEED